MDEGLSIHCARGKVWKVLERQEKRCGWEEMDFSRGARVNQQWADSRRTVHATTRYYKKKKKNEPSSQHCCSALCQPPCSTAMRGRLELYSQKAITWSKCLFSLEMQQGDYQPDTTEGHVNDKPKTFVQKRDAVNWCIATQTGTSDLS